MNRAVHTWRELQSGIADSREWADSLIAQMPGKGLVYGDKPAMVVAEPFFATAMEWERDQVVASAVVDSLVAAGRACIADSHLGGRYLAGWLEGMPDADLFAMSPGYDNPVVFGRLDGVTTESGLRVLEFNGGLPGGVMPSDQSARLLAETDLAVEFAREEKFRTPSTGAAVVEALISTWHDFGGSGLPFTVVALPNELASIAGPGIAYLSEVARERGIELVVVDPGELVFAEGRLRLNGQAVDVMVRAFFTPMFGYLGERLDGIKAALRDGSLCMIASLQSGLFGLKSLFAMVTDPDIDLGLDPAVATMAREAMPWTRLMESGTATDFEGSRVQLPEFVARQRDQLVIKPVEGYGGSGVELGWNHTDESWTEVIARGLAGGHIVQQRVPILGTEFSVLEEGFPVHSFTADHNPLLCNGTIAGYYIRLARDGSGMTNVTGGGATVAPTFLVD